MKKILYFTAVMLLILFLPAAAIWSQETEQEEKESSNLDFGMGLGIGAETFNETIDGVPTPITWQTFSFTPELAFGKFGIGLDLTFHFRFTGGELNDEFEFRSADWVPNTAKDFLPLYLPKFRYVRWAHKGDPLYIKLGSIEDGLLGNGFIVGNYANTLFLPEKRLFGLSFDMDGNLFNFPYIGIETFVANLAAFDVFGSRIYTRPLAWMESEIPQNMQVGVTFAMDRDPYYHLEDKDFNGDGTPDTGSVFIIGGDVKVPIIAKPMVSFVTFGDIAFEKNHVGGMLGFGGRLVKVVPYRAELRILGKNFIPVYFDATYDLFRPLKYEIFEGRGEIPGYIGWLGSTGISLFDDALSLIIAVDGPFKKPAPDDPDNFSNYPHLRADFQVTQDLLPGIFMGASYDKRFLREFNDLIDPEGAVIGAAIGFASGPASISLIYSLRYDPSLEGDEKWEITSGLQSSLSLF